MDMGTQDTAGLGGQPGEDGCDSNASSLKHESHAGSRLENTQRAFSLLRFVSGKI